MAILPNSASRDFPICRVPIIQSVPWFVNLILICDDLLLLAGRRRFGEARLLADGIVTTDEVAALKARSTAAARLARRATAKVTSLRRRIARRQRIAEWNRRGRWRPLIAIAAAKYGVSARGLHRMMMLESGGRRTAGTLYKGLFQYHPSTWRASWNPWRRQSIFDGWAQIRATAYAIRRGMGPSQWPNTYRMAF